MGSTRFCRVLLSFIGFYWVSLTVGLNGLYLGFLCIFLDFTRFYFVFMGFYEVELGFTGLLRFRSWYYVLGADLRVSYDYVKVNCLCWWAFFFGCRSRIRPSCGVRCRAATWWRCAAATARPSWSRRSGWCPATSSWCRPPAAPCTATPSSSRAPASSTRACSPVIWPTFPGFYLVSLEWTGFDWTLLGFTGSCFTEFYLVWKGFVWLGLTGFCLDLLGFT